MTLRLDSIASISRTRGTDTSGDALRNLNFQERYAETLSAKVVAYWERFPLAEEDGFEYQVHARANEQLESENLLIAFRKLREGVLASHRTDAFAVHVYESSFLLAVLFRSPVHATAALAHLTNTLYIGHQPLASSIPAVGMLFVLLHLEHPGEFFARLRTVAGLLDPVELSWLCQLARCKRTGNFVAASRAEPPSSVLCDIDLNAHSIDLYGGRADVRRHAVRQLLSRMAADMRVRTWAVLRAAYRETVVEDSADWLARSLILNRTDQLDAWAEDKIQKGELQQTQANGRKRWTFVRIKK